MDRRGFLIRTLLGLGVAPLAARLASASELSGNPFTLGIASGDATDDSVVLWTRLAPDPLAADGGMPDAGVRVQWELAADPDVSRVLRRGEVVAAPDLAHSVHVDLDGLEPNREYWYRFIVPPYRTVTGRTKTLPRGDSDPGSVRFVVAACQNYTHGYFAAYDRMVEDNPDFVIHLGPLCIHLVFGGHHDLVGIPKGLGTGTSKGFRKFTGDLGRVHRVHKSDLIVAATDKIHTLVEPLRKQEGYTGNQCDG